MNLRPDDDIRTWILQNFDRERYDELYRQSVRIVLGARAFNDIGAVGLERRGLVDYHDISPRFTRIGKSNSMLNDLYIWSAQTLQQIPVPVSVDVDGLTSELRARMFQRRALGTGVADGGWMTDIEKATIEMKALGAGAVLPGIRFSRQNKLPYIDLRYVPLVQVITDKDYAEPHKSPCKAYILYVSTIEAKEEYGLDVDSSKTINRITYVPRSRSAEDRGGGDSYSQKEVVRLIVYEDIGVCGYDPTYKVYVDDLDSEPHMAFVHPFRQTLLTMISYFHPPLCRYPIGDAMMQSGLLAATEFAEERILEDVESGESKDILHPNLIGPMQDAVASGSRFIQYDGVMDDKQLFARIPNRLLDPNAQFLLQYTQGKAKEQSNISQLDTGSPLDGQHTAAEVNQLAGRADVRGQLARERVREFMRRIASTSFEVIRAADREPCSVEVKLPGTHKKVRMTINGDDPRLSAESVFGEYSDIIVDKAAMTASDDRSQRYQRLKEIEMLIGMGMVGLNPGQINLQMVALEALTLLGFENADSMIVEAQQQGQLDPAMLQQMIQAQGQQQVPA